MSLVSFALRLVASRLVRGQTWAGDQVYNSPIDPVAEWQSRAEEGEAKPSVAIYTGDRKVDIVGKATQGRTASLNLVFDIFLPPSVIVARKGVAPDLSIEGDAGQPAITLETNNTGGAMVIDMMARQIEAAFRFGPSPWREIWDILVVRVEEMRSRPLLYEITKGVQVPCVEVTYTLQTVPDPDFGVELLRGWQLLVEAMRADPDYAASADLVVDLISNPAGLANWKRAQAALGLSSAANAAVGVAPVDPTANDDGALLTSISVTRLGPANA